MLQFATTAMVDQLKALWMEGFSGDTEYCPFFFQNYFSPEDCVVSLNHRGEVESAIYAFRGQVRIAGRTHPVLFLYAGATFKPYRRQGKLGAVCGYFGKYCRENGIGLLAGSVSEVSRSACEGVGMRPAFYLRATGVQVDCVDQAPPCRKCGYEEFAAMRGAYLYRDFEVNWTEKTLRYMHAEVQTSGDIVQANINGRTCYAAYTCLEDELLIRETNCPPEDMAAMVRGVCAYADYRGKVTVYTKPDVVPVLEDVLAQEVFCYAHLWFIDETLDLPGAAWYVNLTAE